MTDAHRPFTGVHLPGRSARIGPLAVSLSPAGHLLGASSVAGWR